MIHNDIQNQLALLVKTSAPPLIEVADSPLEAPQWVPGQRLPAHVIASLPTGRFQVQIENQILDMNLPRNTQPGDTLELMYIAPAPRMTFALTPDLERALPTPGNTGVTISDTARFLGALLQKGANPAPAPPANGMPPAPADLPRVATSALNRSAVVVPGAPPPVKEFAEALRTTVSQSGLFYESHQAQWVSGERTLDSLLHEPQAHLPVLASAAQARAAANLTAPPGAPPSAGTLPGAAPNPANPGQPAAQALPGATLPNAPSLRQEANPVLPQTNAFRPGVAGNNHPAERDFALHAASAQELQGPAVARDPVHPLAQPVVHQQLDTLETRHIVWQGQVWPGQKMDWEIDEDGSRSTADEDDEAPRWRTRLHLDLPGLGGVTARLLLDAQGIRVDFVADRDKTANLMHGDVANLAKSMEAAGLKVAALQVNQDDAL